MPYSAQEKALILEEFMQNQSVTVTQRWVRRTMDRNPPSRNDILRWQQQFRNSGNLAHRGGNGRPGRTAEDIARVRLMFQENPQASTRSAATALGIPRTTVQRILKQCLHLYPYKLQNLHALLRAGREKRLHFAAHCQNNPVGYSEYLSRIVFSDECIFRLKGHVNKQNVRIWGNERPSEGNQVFMQSPNVMVWCAVTREKVISPYFFEDGNVDGEKYRNMLIDYAFPRFATWKQDYIFREDGAPAHYSSRVRN